MNNSSDPNVELYSEVVGDLNWNTSVNNQISSTVPVASTPTIGTTLHDPIIIDRRQSIEATDLFAHAPWPKPRVHNELLEAVKEQQYGMAATHLTLLHNLALTQTLTHITRRPDAQTHQMQDALYKHPGFRPLVA